MAAINDVLRGDTPVEERARVVCENCGRGVVTQLDVPTGCRCDPKHRTRHHPDIGRDESHPVEPPQG